MAPAGLNSSFLQSFHPRFKFEMRMNAVSELTVQVRKNHLNLISSAGKAWAEGKTTKNSMLISK